MAKRRVKKVTRKKVRKNPAPASSRVQEEKAARLFENFTGHDACDVARVRIPNPPKAAMVVGHMTAICYSTVRDGKTEEYIHEFKKSAQPILAIGPDGKQVLIIGGNFTFTDRGFVDGR
jgi:hypothetical protein